MKKDRIFGRYSWSQSKTDKKLLKILNWFFDFIPDAEPDDFPLHYAVRKWRKFVEAFKELAVFPPKHIPILPDRLKPKGYNYWDTLDYLYPYSPATRDAVLPYFLRLGWEVKNKKLEKGNDQINLIHPEETMGIDLEFQHYRAGSTCQRVKIGTEMIEQDVFDIICNEAALEMEEQATSVAQ